MESALCYYCVAVNDSRGLFPLQRHKIDKPTLNFLDAFHRHWYSIYFFLCTISVSTRVVKHYIKLMLIIVLQTVVEWTEYLSITTNCIPTVQFNSLVIITKTDNNRCFQHQAIEALPIHSPCQWNFKTYVCGRYVVIVWSEKAVGICGWYGVRMWLVCGRCVIR